MTVTVSAALGLVFIAVVVLVRGQALSRRFTELESNLRRFSREWPSPDAWREAPDDFPGMDVAVYTSTGRLLASTIKRPPPFVKGPRKVGDTLLYGLAVGNDLLVGEGSWVETEAGLRQLALVLAVLWLPLTALTLAMSWHGGGLVLRPVTELVDSANRMSSSPNAGCLTTSDRAEFAALANSLNELIGRVRQSAKLQEQFASDAAHELRNPLALLRTRIETNLMRDRSPEEHIASQKALLTQIERLTAIVETLLQSAREPDSKSHVVDFGESVSTAVEDWADAKGWPQSRLSLMSQPCPVSISHDEVGIIVRNLLDNSARHSVGESPVEVSLSCDDTTVTLSVRDCGQGLSNEEMARAFDRFYRSDEGRSRQDGGAGIGLAVVKRIVEAHGGSVRFLEVEEGALVEVVLPRSSTTSIA